MARTKHSALPKPGKVPSHLKSLVEFKGKLADLTIPQLRELLGEDKKPRPSYIKGRESKAQLVARAEQTRKDWRVEVKEGKKQKEDIVLVPGTGFAELPIVYVLTFYRPSIPADEQEEYFEVVGVFLTLDLAKEALTLELQKAALNPSKYTYKKPAVFVRGEIEKGAEEPWCPVFEIEKRHLNLAKDHEEEQEEEEDEEEEDEEEEDERPKKKEKTKAKRKKTAKKKKRTTKTKE